MITFTIPNRFFNFKNSYYTCRGNINFEIYHKKISYTFTISKKFFFTIGSHKCNLPPKKSYPVPNVCNFSNFRAIVKSENKRDTYFTVVLVIVTETSCRRDTAVSEDDCFVHFYPISVVINTTTLKLRGGGGRSEGVRE